MDDNPYQRGSALAWLDQQLGRLAGLFAFVGGVSILALMLITFVAVIWRYGLNDPIFGVSDVSVMVLSIVAAASVIHGARNNSHVSVNVISYFFGRKWTRITDIFMRILTLGILVGASYALFKKGCGFEEACITENLSIEHLPFYFVIGFSMGLYALHIFLQLILGIVHFNDDRDPNDLEA